MGLVLFFVAVARTEDRSHKRLEDNRYPTLLCIEAIPLGLMLFVVAEERTKDRSHKRLEDNTQPLLVLTVFPRNSFCLLLQRRGQGTEAISDWRTIPSTSWHLGYSLGTHVFCCCRREDGEQKP